MNHQLSRSIFLLFTSIVVWRSRTFFLKDGTLQLEKDYFFELFVAVQNEHRCLTESTCTAAVRRTLGSNEFGRHVHVHEDLFTQNDHCGDKVSNLMGREFSI